MGDSGVDVTDGAGGFGAQGGFGGAPDAGFDGQAGSGGGACVDPGPEPNDSAALASPACGDPTCNLTDCDKDGSVFYGGSFAPATGVLTPGDTDYYTFSGKDTFGCSVNPTATTTTAGFRLCLFVACNVSATNFKSCSQGTHATSPSGLPGCCTGAAGTVQARFSCSSSITSNDSAKIYIRADHATACTPYSIDYHF